ncbi:MAG: hypothetical protein M1837_000639 [Sclerophora amabilis]|nr:MAG: hypothetical protein M1837_000639 [Sclerophora amabilis]
MVAPLSHGLWRHCQARAGRLSAGLTSQQSTGFKRRHYSLVPLKEGVQKRPPWAVYLSTAVIVVLLSGGCFYAPSAERNGRPFRNAYLRNDSAQDDKQWPTTPAAILDRKHQEEVRRKGKEIESKEKEILHDTLKEAHASADSDVEPPLFEDDDSSTWAQFSKGFAAAGQSVSSIEWSSLLVPSWVRLLPDYITKLQRELSMSPGSLADEIWDEAHNSDINPEIRWDATVRVSNDICDEEKDFVHKRRVATRIALARYLGVPVDEVHPDDVPTIAICSSGGGLRALVAGAGSYLSAQEAGLLQCVTYTAGVSGSCWLQTLYNSSLGGRGYDKLVDHLKARLGVHIAFPPTALGLLTTSPTSKFLLSGILEKINGDPESNFGLVDVYGLLLAARLLVPKGELEIQDKDLKISNQRAFVDYGSNPLPIYTAVRHEIPLEEAQSDEGKGKDGDFERAKERAKQESWFQWFEFTPHELWCEELQAGIPTWSVGRKFRNGRNIPDENGLNLPEQRIPLMMGIWGSAFCATLSHYYKEIRPILKTLSGFGGVDQMIEERNDDLIKVHPIDPASIPNYVLGMKERLPLTCPESIFQSSHLKLMDAGMSNNLPIYPLLRPGRNIDILIAFDASADIKTENWLSVADGYARQRGVKGWPIGAGWPKPSEPPNANAEQLKAAQAASPQEAASKVAAAREDQRSRQQDHTSESESHSQDKSESKDESPSDHNTDLGYCNIWVGSTLERTSTAEPPPSKLPSAQNDSPSLLTDTDWQLVTTPTAGLTLIYFPFLANPSKVADIDPTSSEFLSTWNFVYTPDEVEKVVELARANFDEGSERTRRAVRAVWERKRKARLEKERWIGRGKSE